MGIESGRSPDAPDRNVETSATGGCSDGKALPHSSCRLGGAADYPECRAAVAMVTGHQQPDPRVGRPGRESNPVISLSRNESDIQSQGAVKERSPKGGSRLIIWT
jgi:hypothetical protein